MNNRLDFINKFRDEKLASEEMKDIRETFINIDNYLLALSSRGNKEPSFQRSISLARTNLEISLQFTIKSLCLFWELKE